MARVSLHLEDHEGQIALRLDEKGGFDPTSPAHKLGHQIIKFLDEQAVKKTILANPEESNGNGRLMYTS